MGAYFDFTIFIKLSQYFALFRPRYNRIEFNNEIKVKPRNAHNIGIV